MENQDKKPECKFALRLKNGRKISVNVPVMGTMLSRDNPADVERATQITNDYQNALRRHALTVFDIGARTIEAIHLGVPTALGYDRIEDWAWDRFHVKRRTIFYYKYAGAIYYKLMEIMADIFTMPLSHTKLIIVGDNILSSNEPEQIKEYVHDTLTLSGPELQKKYHPKPADHNLKFWFTGSLKNIRVQYKDVTFRWDEIYPETSSENYFACCSDRKVRVYVEVLP